MAISMPLKVDDDDDDESDSPGVSLQMAPWAAVCVAPQKSPPLCSFTHSFSQAYKVPLENMHLLERPTNEARHL